jgi:hypothetical protein
MVSEAQTSSTPYILSQYAVVPATRHSIHCYALRRDAVAAKALQFKLPTAYARNPSAEDASSALKLILGTAPDLFLPAVVPRC